MKNWKDIPERKKLLSIYNNQISEYNAVLAKKNRKIKSLLSKNDILNASIKYRVKSFESYFEKLIRISNNKTDDYILTDMLGIRIICPFLEDLDNVVDIIRNNFNVVEFEKKGAAHSFREFGYDSIHLLVEIPSADIKKPVPYSARVCEIQLRTTLQDAWAEIEHELIYKANFSILNDTIKRKLASLNASLTLSDIIFQEIRDYQKEIQESGRKRRQSLLEKIQVTENISLIDDIHHPDDNNSGHKEVHAAIMKPQDKMEKMIFEALEAHGQGNYAEALKIYTSILKLKPDPLVCSVIHNHRGMIYFVLSEYDKSIVDFTTAVELNKDNFRAYNNLGLTHRMLHQYDDSLRCFDLSLDVNSFQVEAHYSRALVKFDLTDLAGSLEDCQKALNIDINFVPAKRLKGVVEKRLMG